jgi:uncharacterized membrane protein YbhN (UPF0104 family)
MPNRAGEYVGRIFHLEKQDRVKSLSAAFAGSTSQLFVTVFAGLAGMTVLWPHLPVNDIIFSPFLYIAIFIVLAGLLWQIKNLRQLARKTKSGLISAAVNKLKLYSVSFPIGKILSITGIRYLIYAIQFALLISIAGVDVGFFHALAAITIIYLIITFIPTFALFELGVRGSVAILIFSSLTADASGVINASILIWMINLLIPSIVGIYFLLKLNFRTGKSLQSA